MIKSFKHIFSIGSIIFGYAFPLYGVLFQKWDIFSVIFFFWLETCIIVLFQSFKFALMQSNQLRLYLIISYFLGFQALFLSLLMNLYFSYFNVYDFDKFISAFVIYIKQISFAAFASFFSYLIRFFADYIKEKGFGETSINKMAAASYELIRLAYPDLGALFVAMAVAGFVKGAVHSVFVLIAFMGVKFLVDILIYLYINDF